MSIIIATDLPESCLDKIRKIATIVQIADNVDTFIAACQEHQAVAAVTPLSLPLSQATLAALPLSLACISVYAVGVNHVDLDAATELGIQITNTPNVLTDATADFAFSLLLASARRVREADAFVRQGKWKDASALRLLGTAVAGTTLGIIGFGRIGQAMAKRGQGFGMTVQYWNRTRLTPAREADLGVRYASLDDLVATSHFISLHCALSDSTRHILDARRLALARKDAHIVNTARGPCIDEAALADALTEGRIAGAALDVFEAEPTVTEALIKSERTVLAPHIGSATVQCRTAMGDLCADNVHVAVTGSGTYPTAVNSLGDRKRKRAEQK